MSVATSIPAPVRAHSPIDPVHTVWIAIAIFVGLLALALALAHRVAAQRAEQQAVAVVRLVEEHARSTIDRTNLALHAADDLLVPADLVGAATLGAARRRDIERRLVVIQRRTPGIVSMSITDADGRVFANSVGTPPGSRLGDRDYFLALKQEARTTPVVSEAILGRVSNKWGVQVARRIEFPDGRFAGMVVANLGLDENFEKFYETIDLGPNSLITLRDQQNRILVRHPAALELLGKTVAGSATNQFVAEGVAEKVYRATSPIDGIDRILAIRRLSNQPIFAVVGLAADGAFKLWRVEALTALCLALASLLVGRFITATLNARLAAESELHDLNAQLEQRIADRTASLEQALEDLEAFSYSASHDLRAPLRAINGFATLLHDAEREHLNADSQRMLDRITINAEKMGCLIDDILDYSRAGRLPLARGPVDLGALAAAVVADLRELYPHAEVVIGRLPTVSGDATMLRQVLQNLIENACKFSAQQEHPRIDVGCRQRDGRIECFVRDNGVGFDPHYAGKLFRMFHRMHPESQFPGTGVGLAIVQRLIARHGGSIRAEAQPGQGATFLFTLPA
ncbi:MAG: ATP-binding protein [Rhodocyclaceae bacterium]|nr:ATP-binding protein [Rhodocyclaceae bacterium]